MTKRLQNTASDNGAILADLQQAKIRYSLRRGQFKSRRGDQSLFFKKNAGQQKFDSECNKNRNFKNLSRVSHSIVGCKQRPHSNDGPQYFLAVCSKWRVVKDLLMKRAVLPLNLPSKKFFCAQSYIIMHATVVRSLQHSSFCLSINARFHLNAAVSEHTKQKWPLFERCADEWTKNESHAQRSDELAIQPFTPSSKRKEIWSR